MGPESNPTQQELDWQSAIATSIARRVIKSPAKAIPLDDDLFSESIADCNRSTRMRYTGGRVLTRSDVPPSFSRRRFIEVSAARSTTRLDREVRLHTYITTDFFSGVVVFMLDPSNNTGMCRAVDAPIPRSVQRAIARILAFLIRQRWLVLRKIGFAGCAAYYKICAMLSVLSARTARARPRPYTNGM